MKQQKHIYTETATSNTTQPTINASSGVVEYFDIASKRPVSWTPFTARGRMVLSLKRVPHTNTWIISYPDISASHIANNIPPKLSPLLWPQTHHALRHRVPGQPGFALVASGLVPLEKAFPDSPSIFPKPGALAFEQADRPHPGNDSLFQQS